MFWVIQSNLFHEQAFNDFIEALDRRGLSYTMVKPIPMTTKLVSADFDSHSYKGDIDDIPDVDIDETKNIIVMGAISLANIAAKRGWIPGSFFNENSDFEHWIPHYGENLLNYDAKVCRLEEVKHDWDTFFIRPTLDSKSFSGRVYTWDEFQPWQHNVCNPLMQNIYETLDASTMVMYTSKKVIYTETRFFVVDGKVITGSLYKRGDKVIYDSNIDPDVQEFAQKMVDIWQPARAFVIDIALTPSGCKIVECNNINSSGFYNSDAGRIIDALEGMIF